MDIRRCAGSVEDQAVGHLRLKCLPTSPRRDEAVSSIGQQGEQQFSILKLTDFLGDNRVEGLTIVAAEAILHGSSTSVPISRLPAGVGGLPHVPPHTCAPDA